MTTASQFTLAQTESVNLTGTVLSAGPTNTDDTIRIRTAADSQLSGNRYYVGTLDPGIINLGANGSPFACAHPDNIFQLNDATGTTNYDLNIQRYVYSGKWNTGGAVVASAPQFTAMTSIDGGTPRVCDQVCGIWQNFCGDDREYYKLVVPAKKAAVIEAAFSSSVNFEPYINIYNNVGGNICRIMDLGYVSMPVSGRARFVNNTDTPQIVFVAPNGGNSANYNFAIAVEP